MTTVVPLRLRSRTRAGWIAAAAVCLFFGSAGTWVLVASAGQRPAAIPVTALLAGGYLWLGLGALDVARSRGAALVVGDDGLTIRHDGLLRSPILVSREEVEAVTVDLRSDDDRRVSASVRRNAIAPASFLNPSIPVVSAATSSHSVDGTAVTPNLVIWFAAPVAPPRVPLSARVLLRVSQGRTGKYRGPRRPHNMDAVRLVVADAEAAATAFDAWGVLAIRPRDVRYLAPVTQAARTKARRNRLVLVAGVGAITAFFGGLEIVARTAR